METLYIENYKSNIKKLEEIEKIMFNLIEKSKKKKKFEKNGKNITAELLFSKIAITLKSILKILPYTIHSTEDNTWDISSVAALTRNIIENYNMFFYLCVEDVSKDEKDFRLILCDFHSKVEKYKMYKNLDVDNEFIDEQLKIIEIVKQDMIKNNFFNSLDIEKQNDLLKGDKIYYFSKWKFFDIINIDLDKKDIEFMYRFTSNYIHTSPFAIEEIINDDETEIIYTSDLIYAIGAYLKKAVIDFEIQLSLNSTNNF